MEVEKYYVVWVGREPGIYNTWEECREQVHKFPNARFKSFSDRNKAEAALQDKPENHIKQTKPGAHQGNAVKVNYMSDPNCKIESLAVDAACSGNPGPTEYQCVYVKTGKVIFKQGPFPGGTNNIGEFLALVHVLAYQKQNNYNYPIYTDSKIAMEWVQNKHAVTTMKRSANNVKIMDMLRRAEGWLKSNDIEGFEILKWDTKKWGEIPADFGRKK